MTETLQLLENFDVNLFKLINDARSPVFDEIMHWISVKWVWIPLYLLLLWMMFRQFGWKGMLVMLGCGAALVAITDLTSVHLFKELIGRFRPCHNEEFGHLVHTYDGHCGGQFGFVSSHAANMFGIAMFFGLMGRNKYGGLLGILMLWALAVGYSRIYLGVHYPGDVLGGALWGLLLGYGMVHLSRYFMRKLGIKL